MIDKLKCLHDQIVEGIVRLQALTQEELAPVDRLPAARYALTRASRGRTALLESEIYPFLLHYCPESASAIEDLRSEGKTQLAASSRHIATWDIREIQARWPEYCRASENVRTEMLARVAKERALLYPLLEQAQRAAIDLAGLRASPAPAC